VAIGENAQNFFSPNTTALGYSGGAQPNQNYHRLSVQGGVSIGIQDSLTEGTYLSPGSFGHNSSAPSGRFSMLRVHRDRDSSASRANNYPNGIEISIRGNSSTGSATGTKNDSLSLSVWDTDTNSRGSFSFIPGFSISDNGENVNIGPGFPTRNNLSVVGNVCLGDYTFVQSNGFTGPSDGSRIQGRTVIGNTGAGGGSLNPKLTIVDDQNTGGLFVTSGSTLNANLTSISRGSAVIEGQLSVGGFAFASAPIYGSRVTIFGGTGGNIPIGATGMVVQTSMNGTQGANSVFQSTDTGINYSVSINKKIGLGSKEQWRPIEVIDDAGYSAGTSAPNPSGNIIHQIDGLGNSFSRRSVRTGSYHRTPNTSGDPLKTTMSFYKSSQNPGIWEILQLGDDFDVLCSGSCAFTGYFGGRATQIIRYDNKGDNLTLPNQYVTAKSFMTGSANDTCLGWDFCEIIWTRVGNAINCSFIIKEHNGANDSSAAGVAGVKIPLPVMTSSGLNTVTRTYGSGIAYDEGSLYSGAEVKNPDGSFSSIENSLYAIVSVNSGNTGSNGVVRGNFSYYLYY
jgi:hypothetical protein